MPRSMQPLEHEEVKRLLGVTEETGHRIYLVGGYPRDALLKEEGNLDKVGPKDFDFAIEGGHGFAFAKHVAGQMEGHFVPLDEPNDTARVVLPSNTIFDFSGCVGGTIQSDVWRRDFTINSLVWDPQVPEYILDYSTGLADLQSRRVRALSEAVFVEDPLRVLRAYRFASHINGTIEAKTRNWLQAHVSRLSEVAVERINVEIFSIFGNHNFSRFVFDMAHAGLLEIIFPELTETHRVTPNAYHHLGLFEHSMETIPQLEETYGRMPDWVHESAQKELSAGATRLAATKLACLLHDIGKPQTWVVNDDGRHTFYGHDRIGAEMAEVIAERMKWSRPLSKFIVKLIAWHLRPGQLYHQGPPTDKAIRRFYRTVGDDTPELMLLAFADFGATRGPGLMGDKREALAYSLVELLDGYRVHREESRMRVRLLDGSQIMKILEIPGGPIVGNLLAELEEAQEINEVANQAEAVAFVRQMYEEKYSK
jgi:poly(A) polymerase